MFTAETLAGMNKAALRAAALAAGLEISRTANVETLRAALLAGAAEGVVEQCSPVAVSAAAAAPFNPLEAATVAAPALPSPAFTAEYFASVRVPRNLFVPPLASLPGNASRPAKPAKVPVEKEPEQNGQRRPKPGTVCRAIWEWCEAQNAAGVRPEAKALRAALGIGGAGGGTFDHTTCNVQFYAWRRFHGIKGR